ncbi:CoA ester lyase [Streptomonospora sp. S1-112]|uniref:CoA ester lyase n=1 Tax=Streptomonospora mangrovi TaxID=2883123 RepID=A0A9X3NTL4_9ACTN|nr:aldolase/citrate lyase family protein [Streptomonospora mangrovi]MDA0563931.1 CoA ester lyase [Streptomonospora mangrovi]
MADAAPHPALPDAVTWLFVPAVRPDRYAKAIAAGPDAVVVDLEDSVPAGAKADARRALAQAWPHAVAPVLAAGPRPAVVVRVNARTTAEFAADAALCRELRPSAVVLPKAESGEDVRAAAQACGVPVLPLVESARGLVDLREVAACADTARLLFGGVDLALDLGAADDVALDSARADLVRYSAAFRLPPPVDGVTTAVRDPDAAARDAARARGWGFGGKLCVHPSQVAVVAAAFAPEPAEVERARAVLAAADRADAAGEGAVALDGEMIDRPVVERARRLLERAARAARAEPAG